MADSKAETKIELAPEQGTLARALASGKSRGDVKQINSAEVKGIFDRATGKEGGDG